MNKSLQILTSKTAIVFLLLFIISKTSFAQQTDIKYDAPVVIETLILKFPDINSTKVYSALQVALAGTPGVSVRGRCTNADYLFLNVDKRYFPNNADLLKKITDANFVFETVSGKDDSRQNGICSESEIAK